MIPQRRQERGPGAALLAYTVLLVISAGAYIGIAWAIVQSASEGL